MTNLELQLRFTQKLKNHISQILDIRTLDIEFYLNEGLRRFVEDWYSLYETNEGARKRLTTLVVGNSPVSAGPGHYSNGTLYTLPNDCRYVVQEKADLNVVNCHNQVVVKDNVPVKPVKLDYYNRHIDNAFKKPYTNLVWRLDIGNKQHELIKGTDTTSIAGYKIVYIKNPAEITLLTGTPETTSCEISPEFHEELIDKAVGVALETFNLYNSFNTNKQ